MSMEWYRAYHHMPHDPKLKVIAKRTGQPMANVVAIWVCLLDAASQNNERGAVQIDVEEIAVLQDIEVDSVTAIITAFYQKNMLNAENRLTAWDKRQYTTSTERSKKFRADKKPVATRSNTMQRGATAKDAPKRKATQKQTDTDTNKDTDSRAEAEQKPEADSKADTDLKTEKETNTKKNRERAEKEESEKEKQTPIKNDPLDQTLNQMLEIWNAKVQRKLTKDTDAVLTPQRKELLGKRWAEDFGSDLKRWEHYCEVIGESDFCLGKIDGKGWTIDLTWAIDSSEHVVKILEGGFSGGKHPPKPPVCLVPDLQLAWEVVIQNFKQKFGGPCYRSWFTPVVLTQIHQHAGGSMVTIKCPNPFARDRIKDHYLTDIKRWLTEATAKDQRVTSIELTTEKK